MAKKKNSSDTAALEMERFESKIKQFQDYLEFNNINRIGEMDVDASKRHQEIQCQIKIMDALPGWISGLQKLRDSATGNESIELRGDAEPNGMMKNRI